MLDIGVGCRIMQKNYLTRMGIVLAVVLLGLKLWASIISRSMAVLSDALNSFLDVFSYSAIHISVKLQDSNADQNHPFGHRRAEPIASFVIAILAAMLLPALAGALKALSRARCMVHLSFPIVSHRAAMPAPRIDATTSR